MKQELVKALLELIDEHYGYSADEGVSIEYQGQGSYIIQISDRDKLVDLSSREEQKS